jgi:Flp pilus assembly pilin Flp
MKALLSKFRRDEDGAALVEYGIALLVVILVGTAALVGLSQDTQALFQDACAATDAVSAAAGNGTGGCTATTTTTTGN